MNIKVISSVNVSAILYNRGMGKSTDLQKHIAAKVRLLCDPYVPKQDGPLKNTAQITQDGSAIVYNQPYAHYQYLGLVMGPNVLTEKGWRSMAGKGEKYYTGADIQYDGAPMRGPHWEKRMMADHREDIEEAVAAYLRRKK